MSTCLLLCRGENKIETDAQPYLPHSSPSPSSAAAIGSPYLVAIPSLLPDHSSWPSPPSCRIIPRGHPLPLTGSFLVASPSLSPELASAWRSLGAAAGARGVRGRAGWGSSGGAHGAFRSRACSGWRGIGAPGDSFLAALAAFLSNGGDDYRDLWLDGGEGSNSRSRRTARPLWHRSRLKIMVQPHTSPRLSFRCLKLSCHGIPWHRDFMAPTTQHLRQPLRPNRCATNCWQACVMMVVCVRCCCLLLVLLRLLCATNCGVLFVKLEAPFITRCVIGERGTHGWRT